MFLIPCAFNKIPKIRNVYLKLNSKRRAAAFECIQCKLACFDLVCCTSFFWNIRMNTPRESNGRDTKFDGFISFPKIGFVRGWTTTWNVHIVFIERHVCRALPVDIFNYIHLNFGQTCFFSPVAFVVLFTEIICDYTDFRCWRFNYRSCFWCIFWFGCIANAATEKWGK